MEAIANTVFEVNKSQFDLTRVVEEPITELAENEVLLKIDKFALTANNISYAVTGDSLKYWNFFPAEQGWGRIPAMCYSEVVASNCSEIKVGEKLWGFAPMASYLKISAGKITKNSFMDVSPHRKGLAPTYATFDRAQANPMYEPKFEELDILLRGLFITSWLVNDFMQDNSYFGADQYLITSASSKTSIALAFAIKEQGEKGSIGLTSEKNKAFVEALGCYDQIISYQQVAELEAQVPSILVDMAGSNQTIIDIHQHFQAALKYSCRIGATHHDELFIERDLPGAKPTFFFAPTQVQKRTQDWGAENLMAKIALSFKRYMIYCDKMLTVEHSIGSHKIDPIYQAVLTGNADASVGHVISFHSD